MKNTRKQDTAATRAADGVEAARELLARWEAEQSAAQAELESLQSRAGSEVLDDPDAAAGLARGMTELRDRIEIATKAVAAQRPRVVEAEAAWLLAEAELLEKPVAQARTALERHEARTAELLKVLAEHEGPFVPEHLLIVEQARNFGPASGSFSYEVPKSEILRDAVFAAERPVIVLREMAAGRDPAKLPQVQDQNPTDVYPACVWGPDALVKAPAYVRSVAAQHAAAAQAAASLAKLEERVADIEAAIARGEKTPIGFQDWTLAQPSTLEAQLATARRALTDLRARATASTS